MRNSYNPWHHYWKKSDGTLYASATQQEIPSSDSEYQNWLKEGNYPTPYPRNIAGEESVEELQKVLSEYGLRAYGATLGEVKDEKLQQIIAETESAILAGFDYEIDGKRLHFSYQYNDQQNFADTANMVKLSLLGVAGVPAHVIWNGWEVEEDEDGKEVSRTLVQVELSNDSFLALYMQGALAHKARQMALGSERKALVEEATTIEELKGI